MSPSHAPEPLDPAAKLALRRAETETRAIYRLADQAFAPFSCPASGECCQLAVTQRQPWLWPSEWRVLEQAGRRGSPEALPPPRSDGACPFLDTSGKRCSVYADRPLGCRTFFCERIRGPSRQPVEKLDALMHRLAQVNAETSDDAVQPRPLLDWHHDAFHRAL